MAASITLSPRALTWSEDPNWVEFETDLISGGESTEPNLSLYVQVHKDNNFLTELNAPYDLATATTDMDLSGLSLVQPECPADGSMLTDAQGILEKVTCELHLEFEDQYGQPAARPESLQQISAKTVIYGSTPFWYGVGETAKGTPLHSYLDPQGYDAIKEIRKSQPEYIYVYSHDGASVAMTVEVFYTDGTNMGELSITSLTCAARKVSWKNVGWDAINMDSVVNPAKIVNSYQVKVTVDGDDYFFFYALDDHDTEYDQYIMYDNGIGGCEVLRCSGRHTIGVEGTRQTAAMSRVRGRSYREGFTDVYQSAGSQVMQLQTGFLNQYYIRHLSQLFLARKVWYLDIFRDKFVSVTVRESSATVIDMQDDLQNLGFTIVFDEKPSINTFNL